MNRREFLCCTGACGCVLLTGCGTIPRTREVEMDKSEWDISVCGLNCARCKLTAEGKCPGCRIPERWSQDCHFFPCAEAKGHRYCFECDEVPCERVEEFASDGYEHHRLAVENMKKMRQLGLEEWIAQQEKPMFCPGWHF